MVKNGLDHYHHHDHHHHHQTHPHLPKSSNANNAHPLPPSKAAPVAQRRIHCDTWMMKNKWVEALTLIVLEIPRKLISDGDMLSERFAEENLHRKWAQPFLMGIPLEL